MLNQNQKSMDWIFLTSFLIDSLYTKTIQDIDIGNPYKLIKTGFAFDYINIIVFQETKLLSRIV